MTITAMREQIIQRYSTVVRGQRVDRMPDRQVVAIYRSLVNRKDTPVPKRNRIHERVKFEQTEMDLTFDERFRNDQTA